LHRPAPFETTIRKAVEDLIQFLAHYGSLVLFAWVLVGQIGLPLPTVPVLLAAGALAGRGPFQLSATLSAVVCACLLSDLFWFDMGRRGSGKVLNFVCRISLEPDSCVQRASNVIGKYGPKCLLVTRFIPGLSAVAAPLAGSGGVSLPKFLIFDLLGLIFWSGSYLGLGYLFRGQLEDVGLLLGHLKWLVILVLLVVVPLCYVVFKYRQRQKFIREVWMERITPEELLKRIDAGEAVSVVDLRHPLDFLPDPRILPKAIRILPEELDQKYGEIPPDHEVILYCT
jgi:membrane protein DedA with SNARE-associated domain